MGHTDVIGRSTGNETVKLVPTIIIDRQITSTEIFGDSKVQAQPCSARITGRVCDAHSRMDPPGSFQLLAIGNEEIL
jgi:hypothetical protein